MSRGRQAPAAALLLSCFAAAVAAATDVFCFFVGVPQNEKNNKIQKKLKN